MADPEHERANAGGALLATDLALRLTALDLLLRPVGDWMIRPVVLTLAAIALVRVSWLRSPALWLALVVCTSVRVIVDWPLADNHAYLLTYWCLAIALACMVPDRARILAGNGRLLIGLVFAFASVWKFALSGNYFDSTFFNVTLLTDPRFEGFVRIAGGVDQTALEQMRETLRQHTDSVAPSALQSIELTPRLAALATAATWWNLLINVGLACVFLLATRLRLIYSHHVLLLLYCSVTYAIATVDGFGWLLLAMGVAQCKPGQQRLRQAYVAVFVLIICYREVPWAEKVLLPLL